jgi:predicted ferric reductase/Ca2+-binding EF-hand superfamily protein
LSPPISTIDATLLAALDRAFRLHAGGEQRIDLPALQKVLGLRSEYLARRVLSAFDTSGDGSIDRDEFIEGVRRLVYGTDREKLAFAFRVHDHDGDGMLDRQELLRMIAISLAESNVERRTQPPEQLANVLLGMADRNGDGRISLDELEVVAKKRPELLARMTQSEAVWILPNEDLLARVDAGERVHAQRWSSQRGWLPSAFLLLWVAANLAVFLASWLRTPAGPAQDLAMQIGRASARCIDLDGALILVPMMRRLLTRIRATWLGQVLPVDNAVEFHRLLGNTLFALALVHAGAFVLAYVEGHAASPVTQLFFATARGATGLALLAVFVVMWTFALDRVRRSRRFELFYYTHLLYVAWLGLAVAHAPSFLVLAGLPVLGFLAEQVLRRARRRPPSPIVSMVPLRSGVTRLEIARPPGFVFGAGDYVFLRVPAIARGEWHPFTISSAPERANLTFHVRALGNWSSALRRRAEQPPAAPDSVHVDGPFGSPSAHIFQSKYAVLIGAGIGVTPFASVLESVVLRGNGASASPSRLEKVHFFWLNRDQFSFEWFVALLASLEADDRRAMLDVHLCMTDGRAGVTALALELSREIMKAAGRSDLVTGLRTKTHLGPPDWDGLLGAVAGQHDEAPDVFFCGPPGLGAKLRPICARLGMRFREERF